MSADLLSDALTIIRNAESVGKSKCEVSASILIKNILKVMKAEKYIEDFKPANQRKIEVKLIGKINDCRTIKPRLPVKRNEYEKYEKRFLPAKDFGILIVSTQKGIMSHKKAKENGLGGRLLAFVY
ncbi:MAG: 30S ribosomal protein S8 [Candidatus Aenigmatarchaeota archaeon]